LALYDAAWPGAPAKLGVLFYVSNFTQAESPGEFQFSDFIRMNQTQNNFKRNEAQK
jgi:hypothetical protein